MLSATFNISFDIRICIFLEITCKKFNFNQFYQLSFLFAISIDKLNAHALINGIYGYRPHREQKSLH